MRPVKNRRKKKAREIRKGMGVMPNNGDVSTHLMESMEYDGKNYVYPTIYPVSPNKYVDQSFDEAWKRGEVFEFKSPKRADRFARGSWKPRALRK